MIQDSLYPLSAKDIEAVGKSRVYRDLPQNVKWWLYGGLITCMAGFLYGAMIGSGWIVVGVLAVGAVCVWYSTTLSDKIRGKVVRRLKLDWIEEQNKEAE